MKKVYGPYKRKSDNRNIVRILYKDGTSTTKSYARYMYENHHGPIDKNLHVDHIDENRENDVLENFQLLTSAENNKKSAKPEEIYTGNCSVCNIEFSRVMRYVRGNLKKNRAGPFCSRKCAGIYSMRAYAN